MMDLDTLFVYGCSLLADTISSVFVSVYESFQLIDSLWNYTDSPSCAGIRSFRSISCGIGFEG